MKSDQKFLYRLLCSIILTVIAAGSFYYAWNCFIQVKLSPDTLIGHDILIIVMSVYAFVFCLSFLKMRGFSIGADRKINTVASQVIALLTTDIIEIMVMMAVIRRSDSFGLIISDILILFLVQSVIIPLVSVIMIEIYRKVFPPLSLVEIYGNDKNDIYIKMGNVRYKYFIDERLHYQSENVKEAISEHDAVLISDVPVSERDRLLQYCFDIGKRVYFTPEIGAFYAFGTTKQRDISLIFSGSAGDPQNRTATVGISDFSTELHGFELAANLFALEYKPSDRIGIAVSFGQIEYVSLSGDAQEKNISIDSQTIGFRMNTSAVVGLRFYL